MKTTLNRILTIMIITQLSLGCVNKVIVSDPRDALHDIFSINGEFLISSVISLIIPSAHADDFERLKMEFEKELAIARGRTDGLEAKTAELESLHPAISPITNTAETKCNSLDNLVSYSACPKGEYCAFIRKAVDYRHNAEFACGVILNEEKSFNFQFPASVKKVLSNDTKLEVIMVNGDLSFDQDMFNQAKEDIGIIRARLISLESALESCKEPLCLSGEIESQVAITRGMIDGNEAKIGELEARRYPNVILGIIVNKENQDKKLLVDTEANLAYWSSNRFEEYVEYHQDPWMDELKSFMTFKNTLIMGQWAFDHGLFGVEDLDNPDWLYTNLSGFFNNTYQTTLESFDYGKNSAYLVLDRFTAAGYPFEYEKELREYDEHIINRKSYVEHIFSQIILEKATDATTPLISSEKMIAGLNSLNSSIDHELLLKYFRAEIYLDHAAKMGFEMIPLQGIVTIRDAVKLAAVAIITSVQNGGYLPDVSWDGENTEAYVENAKKELVMNIASCYFSNYFGYLSDPYFYAPEAIRDLYVIL